MSIKVGIVGVGKFAQNFIPLFKAHPLVEEVTLCDLDDRKLTENCEKHKISKRSHSLDHLCTTDVDAIVIITQNWLHGPQAVKALRAGKHVYSAVPIGISVDEIKAVVDEVETTGKIYMMGETSYYYPAAIYCRERFREGAFGNIVYAESEYLHDWEHGLYDVAKWRGGEKWKETAGTPPMYYPTHSISQVTSVTGAHITQVSCFGFVDTWNDGIYLKDVNIWGNTFSNQTALFKLSDGSCCRINEFRRVGHPGSINLSIYGTMGSFEKNNVGSVWLTRDRNASINLDDLISCRTEIPVKNNSIAQGMDLITANDGTHKGVSPIHPVGRLPKEFIGLPNGHEGSHQFLVDDFVRACTENKTPPNNVWDSARYTVPGIIAHESALRGGELLDVPDFGDPKI